MEYRHVSMSLRDLGFLSMGILGVALFSEACTYQMPELSVEVPRAADWWDAEWTHRIRITFQNAGGESLTDFPVLVRLDEQRLPMAQDSPVGADLRFVDDDGQTILSHEIDRWVANGESFVWVRVPKIDATNTDHIWLYYGNPNASDAQNAADVWDDFIGVYHLSPSQSVPIQFVNSAGANPGGWYNDVPGNIVTGPIGDAVSLDGSSFVHIGDNGEVAANPDEARTAEAWVNASNLQPQAIVYEEGQCVGWYLGMNANGEYLGSFITEPILPLCADGGSEFLIATPAFTGAWHYVTLVVDRPGLEMRLFVDGTLMESTPTNNTEIADGNGIFRIGSDHDGGEGTFAGAIDEVRVSNNARSAGWIAAQYKSMSDRFLSFTVDESE
ncbi:MAG TPA: DUF2341 domain-containing protein [Polyangium sp.]|nr:DUF2341 domain-containing protein [Polyangium sp.]